MPNTDKAPNPPERDRKPDPSQSAEKGGTPGKETTFIETPRDQKQGDNFNQ